MTVKDFCAEYGVAFQTVYKKIERHKDKELHSHIFKEKGSPLDIDDYAAEFLKPQRVKNIETLKTASEVNAENIRLKGELNKSAEEIFSLKLKLENAGKRVESDRKAISGLQELLRDEKEISCNCREGINTLKNQLEEKDKIIGELNSAIEADKEQIDRLNAALSEKDSVIENLRAENEEMKSRKIFIGIGKKKNEE